MLLSKAFCRFVIWGTILCPVCICAQNKINVPENWTYSSQYQQTMPDEDQWWAGFNDPLLDTLISLGVRNNYNLSAAAHRINIASQELRKIKAGYYPSLGVSAGWNKSRISGNTSAHRTKATTNDYFSTELNASWEIDLFGRISEQAKEQKGMWNASRAEYAATMVSLCANIAQTYIELCTAEVQLGIANAHLKTQGQVLHITEVRYETGLSSKLDVAQAATIYHSTEATIPGLRTRIAVARNALSVLIGSVPEDNGVLNDTIINIPEYVDPVGIGIPADVIRRRPDIVEAEYNLAAAAAGVGIAKKDFLPTITINGSIGFDSHKFRDMFSGQSLSYTIAPTISWTIFDGFARNANVAAARENMLAMIDNYNLTVTTAFEEVENALVTYEQSKIAFASIKDVVNASQEAFDLSLDLYKQGLTDFTDVADAQINLISYSDQLASAKGEIAKSLITLYTAIGGGWNPDSLN